jgi:PPK2 family polyphosphate:nucleotide phosphotransferase
MVEPGREIRLADMDPADTLGVDREEAEKHMEEDLRRLTQLQELLYVAGANAVLVILQGTDTSGKDGTIRHVFQGVSPLGCSVAGFGVPSEEELAHDFLWRIHKQCPRKGMLTIFNRSHYESVLVELVHGIVDEKRVRERYEEINAFERMLAREGTIILKFFLNISKGEQEERLNERIKEPDKNWKVNPGDWEDRERWDEFRKAYESMLNHTSTEWAPWAVVPSDRKWFRNYLVAHRLSDVMAEHEEIWHKALRERGDTQKTALKRWRDARK